MPMFYPSEYDKQFTLHGSVEDADENQMIDNFCLNIIVANPSRSTFFAFAAVCPTIISLYS